MVSLETPTTENEAKNDKKTQNNHMNAKNKQINECLKQLSCSEQSYEC